MSPKAADSPAKTIEAGKLQEMVTYDLAEGSSDWTSKDARHAAQAVTRAKRVVVLTGAGISCSAGIPDFRSLHGLRNTDLSCPPTPPPEEITFTTPPGTPRRRVTRAAAAAAADAVTSDDFPPSSQTSQSSVATSGAASDYSSSTDKSLKRKRGSGSLPTIKGAELFDVSLFNAEHTTRAFYQFMSRLRNEAVVAKPTPMHKLIKTLRDNKKLVRCYTQNIDGLERGAGLITDTTDFKGNDALQLHGDLHTLRCDRCSERVPYASDLHEGIMSRGDAPECPRCAEQCALRVVLGRRTLAVGMLRPDVVLYGEQHPKADVIGKAVQTDVRRRPDCVLVCGTSLKIPGFKAMVKKFAALAREQKNGKVIFVNMEPPTAEWRGVFDYHFQGATDSFCQLLQLSRPDFFLKQATIECSPIESSAVTATTIVPGRPGMQPVSESKCNSLQSATEPQTPPRTPKKTVQPPIGRPHPKRIRLVVSDPHRSSDKENQFQCAPLTA